MLTIIEMEDLLKSIDMEQAISYSNDLVEVLKKKWEVNSLMQCIDNMKTLRASCDNEFSEAQSLLQDYESKIDACRQKTEIAKSEAVGDDELELLQKELEEEQKKESLLLEEFRVINDEIDDLEHKRISVQDRKQSLKKLEQDEIRAQSTLSMFASVTNIIPDLDDPSKVSGHIIDRDKKAVQKFEFDPTQMTAFDTCNTIWKKIVS